MSKFNDFMLQWGADKFMHFMSGAAGYGITESWIIVLIMALGKELYDHISYGGWNNKDAFATVLGGVGAFVGIHVWDWLPYTELVF